jgi:hypothetical protein
MSSEQIDSPIALESIFAGFADLVGVPITGDSPDTLEMAFENYAIRAGVNPADSSKLRVLVEVARLDLLDPASSAALLLDLHHFNADQRPSARWLATIEEDNSLNLCGDFEIEGMDAQALHAILCEAIDKAEAIDPARQTHLSNNTEPNPKTSL